MKNKEKVADKGDTFEKEYQAFCDYVANYASNDTFLKHYLMSGLSSSNNLSNKLTPGIFRKYFYVSRSEEYEKKIDKKIKDLFDDPERNVMGLCSHGGSGKTVFMKLLPLRLINDETKDYKREYIIIDLESSMGAVDPYTVVTENIIESMRKFINTLFVNPTYQLEFHNYVEKISVYLDEHNPRLIDLWREVKDIIYNKENIRVAEAINRLMRSLSFEKIRDITWTEGLKGVQIACLLMMTIILSNPDEENKFVIVFDNIEAITNKDNSKLPNIIYATWQLLRNVATNLNIIQKFFHNMTFIVSVRTTTDLYDMTSEHSDSFWGPNNKYIHQLHYNDFCAEALLKKLKFLNSHKRFRETKLRKSVELICAFVCSPSTITKAENAGDDISYKYFTNYKLSPFFGNNFRQVVMQLCSCIEQTLPRERIDLLMQDKHNWNIVINGARGILINSIINNLKDNVLTYFGIGPIDGTVNHSATRILLSYLYWNKIQYCLKHRNLNNYQGVTLKRILEVFQYFYKDNIETLAELIYKLSPFHYENAEKLKKISNLSYLIIINGMESNCSVEEFKEKACSIHNEAPVYQSEITIDLSDAGLCYVTSISTHFEFLNARQNYGALYLTELETDAVFNKYIFEERIYNHYQALENYVQAMINNGFKGCNFNADENNSCLCKHIDWNNPQDIEKLLVCSRFIRYLEVSAAIIESINYIDRYRQYLLIKYKDEEINKKILGLLRQYADLLRYVRSQYPTNSNKSLLTGSLFFNTYASRLMKDNNLIRLPHKAYYYEGRNGEDKIYDAIDYEQEHNIGEDLFVICEKAV